MSADARVARAIQPYTADPGLSAADNAEREWSHIRRHALPADVYAAMNRVAGLPDDAGEVDRSRQLRGRSPYDRAFAPAVHVEAYHRVIADRESGNEAPRCTPQAMTAAWGEKRHSYVETIRKTVDLTGAPPVTVTAASRSKVHGGLYSPYSVTFEYIRRAPAAAWHAEVTIYAARQGDPIGSHFGPDRIANVPQWLTDLIEQAAPKETT